MSNILNPFKPIIKSDVNVYVEAFGNDDYETRCNKILIIKKLKKDVNNLKRSNHNNYVDYENMLKEKYEYYKKSLQIQSNVGDDGGSYAPVWFKNAVKHNGEYVKHNGEFVTYSG